MCVKWHTYNKYLQYGMHGLNANLPVTRIAKLYNSRKNLSQSPHHRNIFFVHVCLKRRIAKVFQRCVVWIRNVFPDSGSRIWIFSIPDPWSASKNFMYFNHKKWFLSSRKYVSGCSFRILDPDPVFYPSKKAPDPGSGSATLSNGILLVKICKLRSNISFKKYLSFWLFPQKTK